jgi:hypothetical protein
VTASGTGNATRVTLGQTQPQRECERDEPAHSFTGGTEVEVENELRAWVDTHYPRETPP